MSKSKEQESQEPEVIEEQVLEQQSEQQIYTTYAKKVGGCVVVSIDDEVVSAELPITYDELVSLLIGKKYSPDHATAVLANYFRALSDDPDLSNEKKAEYTAEHEAFQQWRILAKEVARVTIFGA